MWESLGHFCKGCMWESLGHFCKGCMWESLGHFCKGCMWESLGHFCKGCGSHSGHCLCCVVCMCLLFTLKSVHILCPVHCICRLQGRKERVTRRLAAPRWLFGTSACHRGRQYYNVIYCTIVYYFIYNATTYNKNGYI